MRFKRAILLLLILALAGATLAMATLDYAISWLQNLSGSGGPLMSTSSYQASVTVGQTAIFTSQTEKFTAIMGFWSAFPLSAVFLPVIVR